MFYTPKFCCECGDKIEREQWKFSTSRKFCESCENDFKFQKWTPALAAALGLLGIIFGFGSYLKKSEKPESLLAVSSPASVPVKSQGLSNQSNKQSLPDANVQSVTQKTEHDNNAAPPNLPSSKANSSAIKQNAPQGKSDSAEEAIYICGAQTKKGTACMRRVKGGGRCWQHTGQPAILPPEKLIISR